LIEKTEKGNEKVGMEILNEIASRVDRKETMWEMVMDSPPLMEWRRVQN
jgi:hypothetical protein